MLLRFILLKHPYFFLSTHEPSSTSVFSFVFAVAVASAVALVVVEEEEEEEEVVVVVVGSEESAAEKLFLPAQKAALVQGVRVLSRLQTLDFSISLTEEEIEGLLKAWPTDVDFRQAANLIPPRHPKDPNLEPSVSVLGQSCFSGLFANSSICEP